MFHRMRGRASRLVAQRVGQSVVLWPWLLLVCVQGATAAQNCPQPRVTGKAPQEFLAMVNPATPGNAATERAAALFDGLQRVVNCVICHGKTGAGNGPLSSQYDPPPRNFSCAKTIEGVPDGQLFWIIRFGSPGTAMPGHRKLKDDQIWELVLYLRQLAK